MRVERSENMQTVLPAHIQTYLRQLAIVHYTSLHLMYDDMAKKFIQVGPWAATPPLPWREAPMRDGPGCSVANVTLSKSVALQVDEILVDINNPRPQGFERYGVTRKTFLYTAIMWWITYIYPKT